MIKKENKNITKIEGGSHSSYGFWGIIYPLVASSITICTFLLLTDCFKMFDQNLALTAGAPAGQTTMLALDIYNTYYNRIGFAGIGQAKSVLFTMIVFLLVMIQLQIWEKEKGRNYAVF